MLIQLHFFIVIRVMSFVIVICVVRFNMLVVTGLVNVVMLFIVSHFFTAGEVAKALIETRVKTTANNFMETPCS